MKFSSIVLLILLGSCNQIEITKGEVVDFPRPFAAADCLNVLESVLPNGVYMGNVVRPYTDDRHAFSWTDTLIKGNGGVFRETYFGDFEVTIKRSGICDWFGVLDSIRLEYKSNHQIITLPEFSVFIRPGNSPVIDFFGNDTTIIQGFKIFLDGSSGATGNSVYDYYLYNDKTGRYVHDTILSGLSSPHINLAKGTVVTSWNGGAAGRIGGRTMYKLTVKGQLEFLKSWYSQYKDEGYLVERIEVRNGRRMKSSKMVATDEWQYPW